MRVRRRNGPSPICGGSRCRSLANLRAEQTTSDSAAAIDGLPTAIDRARCSREPRADKDILQGQVHCGTSGKLNSRECTRFSCMQRQARYSSSSAKNARSRGADAAAKGQSKSMLFRAELWKGINRCSRADGWTQRLNQPLRGDPPTATNSHLTFVMELWPPRSGMATHMRILERPSAHNAQRR